MVRLMLLIHYDGLIAVEDLIHLNLNVNPPLLAISLGVLNKQYQGRRACE